MFTLADGPMRLIVSDTPQAHPGSDTAWFVLALWMGIAILVLTAAVVLRRWLARPADPYEQLLRRVCESAGVSIGARTKLLMHAGGDAREALGQLMLKAMQRRERETSPPA